MRRARATIKLDRLPGLRKGREKARFYWCFGISQVTSIDLNRASRGSLLQAPTQLSRRSFVSGTLATGLSAAARGQTASPAQPRILRVTKSGYDGQVPGPELRAKRGEEFAVRVVNELDEPTAVHWHGVRLANAMDGAPPLTQAPILPGASFDYRFVAPDAGTFWYHPLQRTNERLHGALIVAEPDALDVDHEMTLSFSATSDSNKFTVNGTDFATFVAAAKQRVRLRLINTTVSQILKLRIADLRTFVMAIDGQPAQPFTARGGELTLGPGNRIDAFVDLPPAPDTSVLMTIEDTNGASTPIAKFVAKAGQPVRATPRDDPKPLPPNPLPERMDFPNALRFAAAIARPGSVRTEVPQFTVKRGRTVMFAIANSTFGFSDPPSENAHIHLHGHSFRLLDVLDDGWKPFWLDTMPIAPAGMVRIAFVADNPGKWLIEGLYGSNAWFEVT